MFGHSFGLLFPPFWRTFWWAPNVGLATPAVQLKVKGCLTPLMAPTLALLGFKLLVSACDRFGTYMLGQPSATKTGSQLYLIAQQFASFCLTQLKVENLDFAILYILFACINIQNMNRIAKARCYQKCFPIIWTSHCYLRQVQKWGKFWAFVTTEISDLFVRLYKIAPLGSEILNLSPLPIRSSQLAHNTLLLFSLKIYQTNH